MQPIGEETASAYTSEQILSWTYRADAVAQCLVIDILQMQAFSGYFQLGTFPCRLAQIVGVLVGVRVNEKWKSTIYTLDDGTGVIDCVCPLNRPVPHGLGIGGLVRCLGRVTETSWKGRMMDVNNLDVIEDPSEQPRHWQRVGRLHASLYGKPFIIPLLCEGSVTPMRRRERVDSTASSSLTHSSLPATPETTSAHLQHPSKLRSKHLGPTTFLLYMKEYLKTVLADCDEQIHPHWEAPLHTQAKDTPGYPNAAPRLLFDATPSRLHRISPQPDAEGRSSTGSRDKAPAPAITLWDLRQVKLLAHLALRTVQAAKRKRRKSLETNERALTYRVETSKHERESDAAKAKRLYDWALRTLLSEGFVVIGDPSPSPRALSDIDVNRPSFCLSRHSSDEATAANATAGTVALTGGDVISSSPRPVEEETYLLVTPSLLMVPVLQAVRSCNQSKKKKGAGVSVQDIESRMKRDERWKFVGTWDVEETLVLLERREEVCRMGGGEWGLM